MANGYQRVADVSDLSLKVLNDQLEQLWRMVDRLSDQVNALMQAAQGG